METNAVNTTNTELKTKEWSQAITLEVALHTILVLGGLVMRLAQLGRFPLLASEANTALAAWRGVHGELWRPALYSPLLFGADYLPLALLGGSDIQIRLLTALAGAALVALPFFARDLLGHKGSLLAAAILAFSPTWVLASRIADGQIVAILALCIALLAYVRHEQGRKGALRYAWAALAVALISSWNAYTPILALLLASGWQRLRARRLPEMTDEEDERAMSLKLASYVTRDALVGFGVVLILGASTFGLNVSGIGASVSLAGHWVATLWPGTDAAPWYTLLSNLISYESLVAVLGLVGLVLGLKSRKALDLALAWWAGVALMLGVLLGHRAGLWLVDALLPLTLLAARGFDRVTDWLHLELEAWDWGVLWGSLCLSALAFLQLATYIQNGQTSSAWLAGLGLGLVVLSLAAYGFWRGGIAVARVGVWLVVLLLASHSLSTSVSLNYRTTRDAHEALVGDCTGTDIAGLSELVQNSSLRLVQDKRAAVVHYDASLDPLVGWYLRDMTHAVATDFADARSGADILITEDRDLGWYPDSYAAQRVALRNTWPEQQLTTGEKLRWLIYRDDVGTSQRTYIQVWTKLQTASSQP